MNRQALHSMQNKPLIRIHNTNDKHGMMDAASNALHDKQKDSHMNDSYITIETIKRLQQRNIIKNQQCMMIKHH